METRKETENPNGERWNENSDILSIENGMKISVQRCIVQTTLLAVVTNRFIRKPRSHWVFPHFYNCHRSFVCGCWRCCRCCFCFGFILLLHHCVLNLFFYNSFFFLSVLLVFVSIVLICSAEN